jgi:hypothetical protein
MSSRIGESMKEYTIDQVVAQLIAQLHAQMTATEEAEMAIAIYKKANWAASLLEEVKQAALVLAQEDMEQRGIDALKTAVGSAGWTKPEARQLQEQQWHAALAGDPKLLQLQRAFDLAQGALHQAQETYRALPEPRFVIR